MPAESTSSDDAALGLEETLQIMDVAVELREQRELARRELNADQVRKELQERLLNAARLTGESVTPAEVDTAIEHYFDSLHAFRDPETGLTVLLAHLYIRRGRIVSGAIIIAGLAAAIWYMVF